MSLLLHTHTHTQRIDIMASEITWRTQDELREWLKKYSVDQPEETAAILWEEAFTNAERLICVAPSVVAECTDVPPGVLGQIYSILRALTKELPWYFALLRVSDAFEKTHRQLHEAFLVLFHSFDSNCPQPFEQLRIELCYALLNNQPLCVAALAKELDFAPPSMARELSARFMDKAVQYFERRKLVEFLFSELDTAQSKSRTKSISEPLELSASHRSAAPLSSAPPVLTLRASSSKRSVLFGKSMALLQSISGKESKAERERTIREAIVLFNAAIKGTVLEERYRISPGISHLQIQRQVSDTLSAGPISNSVNTQAALTVLEALLDVLQHRRLTS